MKILVPLKKDPEIRMGQEKNEGKVPCKKIKKNKKKCFLQGN